MSILSRWRILTSISYTNYNKLYPQAQCWKRWFSVSRYWGGKIININVRHHQLAFDFRRNWLADMTNPNRK